jgi:hypothetical protein
MNNEIHDLLPSFDHMVIRGCRRSDGENPSSEPETAVSTETTEGWEFDFGWPTDSKGQGQLKEDQFRVIGSLGKPMEDHECRELLLKVMDWNRIVETLQGPENAVKSNRSRKGGIRS